jgi:hypothetical protein
VIIKRVALAFAFLAGAVLVYGYWHAETHATLYVSLTDVSERNRYQPILDAELSFMNTSGHVVAKAKPEAPHGAIYLSEPGEYACHQFEQPASFSAEARGTWKQCFEEQSRWLATRVPEITSVMVETGSCQLEFPVTIAKYQDWWFWWVPLPHVGGTPYTNYSISVAIDRAKCISLAPRGS